MQEQCVYAYLCALFEYVHIHTDKQNSLLFNQGVEVIDSICAVDKTTSFHTLLRNALHHFFVEPATNLNRDTVEKKNCKTCQGVQ